MRIRERQDSDPDRRDDDRELEPRKHCTKVSQLHPPREKERRRTRPLVRKVDLGLNPDRHRHPLTLLRPKRRNVLDPPLPQRNSRRVRLSLPNGRLPRPRIQLPLPILLEPRVEQPREVRRREFREHLLRRFDGPRFRRRSLVGGIVAERFRFCCDESGEVGPPGFILCDGGVAI